MHVLKQLPEQFIIYGYDEEKQDSNLKFKKTGMHMLKDLGTTKAVIASAGFTLLSEALYLKKPYFAIPLRGQFEQTMNALFLKQSGYGTFSEDPSLNDLRHFLHKLSRYRKKLRSYKSDPQGAINVLDKILKQF